MSIAKAITGAARAAKAIAPKAAAGADRTKPFVDKLGRNYKNGRAVAKKAAPATPATPAPASAGAAAPAKAAKSKSLTKRQIESHAKAMNAALGTEKFDDALRKVSKLKARDLDRVREAMGLKSSSMGKKWYNIEEMKSSHAAKRHASQTPGYKAPEPGANGPQSITDHPSFWFALAGAGLLASS